MLKKRYLFLIIIIFLLSISVINAQELDNNTDINQISSDFNDMDLYESYGQNTNQGSFKELNSIIKQAKEGSSISLEKDYCYNHLSDNLDIINITKKITIEGNNHVINGYGSSCNFLIENDNVNIRNIYFKNFNSHAIRWNGNNGYLDDCTFFNNSAKDGGAVYWEGNNGIINNCKFYNNNAYRYFGGAVLWTGNYGIINDCTFEYNSIKGNQSLSLRGGAVYWSGNYGILSNLKFSYNSAVEANSIYYRGNHGSIINCNCYFKGNLNGRIDEYDSEINLNNNYNNNPKYNDFVVYDIPIFEGLKVDDNQVNIEIKNVALSSDDSSVTFEIYAYDKFGLIPIDYIYTYYNKLERYDVVNNKVTIYSSDYYLENNVILPIQVVIGKLNIFKSMDVYTQKEMVLYYLYSDKLNPEVNIISSKSFNSNAIVKVNNNVFHSQFKNGILELRDMFYRGNFLIEVELDDSILSGYLKFNVFFEKGDYLKENIFNLTGNDVKAYYKNCKYNVKLTDYYGNPKANEILTFYLNDIEYNRTTDKNGVASLNINLNTGNYDIAVKYPNNNFKVNSLKNKITILPTISGNDITKIYKNNTQYYAKFVDGKGNPLKNTGVKFNINGVFYTRTTNDQGMARLNINLNPEKYIITAENLITGEKHANTITVLPNIIENYDLTKYYKNSSQYRVKLLDNTGKPVGAGVNVIFNINGVFYTRSTDANGYAKMNINLNPGKYIITADYKGLKVSNTIKVLSVLSTSNLQMKYASGTQFKVKVLDGKGNAYPNQKVKFNINGVFYERTSDSSGYASLNINLQPGTYTITSMYNGLCSSNEIDIYDTNNGKSNSRSSSGVSNTLCLSNLDSNAATDIWIYTGSSSNHYFTKTDFLGRCSVSIVETINEYHKIEVKTSYTGFNYKYYSGTFIIYPNGELDWNIPLVKKVNPSTVPLSDIKIVTT